MKSLKEELDKIINNYTIEAEELINKDGLEFDLRFDVIEKNHNSEIRTIAEKFISDGVVEKENALEIVEEYIKDFVKIKMNKKTEYTKHRFRPL